MTLYFSCVFVLLAWFACFATPTTAQFQFFEQMFGHQHQHQQQQQQHRRPQNVPSDASRYVNAYQESHCTDYLCPDTLACVAFPHHCPCPWPHHDKFELAEGQRICVSKGGFKPGEAARKVELARKGYL